jgi:hypothetical protein
MAKFVWRLPNSRGDFGIYSLFSRYGFHPARFGRVFYQLGKLGVGASQPFQLLDFLVVGCPCAFARCHMASHDWPMWWPFIGPRHYTTWTYHIIFSTSTYHITCRVVVRSATLLYGLSHGTFPLVHRLAKNFQNRVTHGSLWCCHIIMMTSS